jgi:formylglycine-generating enzyme required for sulfatase activity
MPKIFISYRRLDSACESGRIYDWLSNEFGKRNVFLDTANIIDGEPFPARLIEEVKKSKIVLVIIGSTWLSIKNRHGVERLNDVDDWVRREIELSLNLGKIIIPVLLNNTPSLEKRSLPESIEVLATLNARPIRTHDFESNIKTLIESIRQREAWLSRYKMPVFLSIVFLFLVILLFFQLWLSKNNIVIQVAGNPTPTEEVTEIVTEAAIITESPTDEPTAADTGIPTSEPTLTESPSPEPTLTEYEAALERAWNFVGTLNSDWTPYINAFDDVDMALVPAGCFVMGSTDEQVQYAVDELDTRRIDTADEQPAEPYCIEKPFWIDVTEVTQGDFVRLGGVQETRPRFIGDLRPVENITWFEAQDYCERLSKRLPTEAEWEFAARGVEEWIFPWGNTFIEDNVVFNLNTRETDNVGSRSEGISWVGAMDMSGNVLEWTLTPYKSYPYHDTVETSNNSDDRIVLRGGSLGDGMPYLRSAYRFENEPNHIDYGIGFRCARDIEN